MNTLKDMLATSSDPRGDYVAAEIDEPMSAIKLVPIKLSPNDYDEEDSTSPMVKRSNAVSPAETDDEEKKSSLDPLNDKFKELVSIFAITDEFSGEEDSVDVTLLQASAEGEISVVKERIEDLKRLGKHLEVGINLEDDTGFTALHLAARYNRKNVVNYLIENGADMNKAGKEGLTPLHLATKYNMTATAKCLIQKGADVNILSEYGTTVLFFAARRGNVDIVEMLLEIESVEINKADNSDVSPLHAAMIGGSEDVTQLLIDHNANIMAVDKEGEMPIHYAAAENNGDLIVMLAKGVLKDCNDKTEQEKLQREFVNSGSKEMDTALHIAAQGGYEETVKTMIQIGARVNARTDTRQTPLHLAAIGGQLPVVKFLIMNHAKVNSADDQQMTPLHKASQFGRLEVCRFLLASGAKLNAKDRDNFTPLMLAVWKGQNEIVEFLIEQGADLNLTDMNLKTVLHLAIEEDEDETLKLLFEKGAKNLLNAQDKDYKTPLHYAAQVGNVEAIEILLELNADTDMADNQEKNPIHTAAECGETNCVNLLGKVSPGSVNYNEETGKSPLHLAAMNGYRATCNALIEMGAETSSRDDVNWTPLDYAALNGHSKVMIVLLDNDAPKDACDKYQATPLHHACENGHTDCIDILLNHGASIKHKNFMKKNCLDLAVENGQVDACLTLITHERWKEAMRTVDNEGFHPMEKLIAIAPSVAGIVLDKCVTATKEDYQYGEKTLKCDKIVYDFEFLDIEPDQQVNQLFFAPSNMVKHQREDLLSHRLTVKLINDKWARLGRWIYILSLFFYLLFLGLLTSLLIMDKERISKEYVLEKSTFEKAVSWLTVILALIQFGKEFIQMYYLGIQYFKDPVNYMEIILYFTSILFMVPFLAEDLDDSIDHTTKPWKDIKWNAGSVAILLAWGNLLLYLKRFPFFGLYVVMFTEVFKTLLSVLLVFSIFIVGFALSFFVLLDNDVGFRYAGRSIVKTGVMTIGEFEFNDIFTDNYDEPKKLPYKVLTYIVFVAFMGLMPILIMNFLHRARYLSPTWFDVFILPKNIKEFVLFCWVEITLLFINQIFTFTFFNRVGLAVGDIEAVRKNAYLRILKAQVKILKTIESSYPQWLLKKVYRPSVEEVIKEKMSFNEKWVFWWGQADYDSVKEEQDDAGGIEKAMMQNLESNRLEIEKQKKRLKLVCDLLDEQNERLSKVCEKLDIEDNVD